MAKLNSFQSWSLTIIFYSFHIFWLEIYIFFMTWPWWKIHLFVIFIPTLRKNLLQLKRVHISQEEMRTESERCPSLSLSLSPRLPHILKSGVLGQKVWRRKKSHHAVLLGNRHTSSLSKTDRKNGRLARGKCCTVDSWKPQRVTGDASLLWGRFWFN